MVLKYFNLKDFYLIIYSTVTIYAHMRTFYPKNFFVIYFIFLSLDYLDIQHP